MVVVVSLKRILDSIFLFIFIFLQVLEISQFYLNNIVLCYNYNAVNIRAGEGSLSMVGQQVYYLSACCVITADCNYAFPVQWLLLLLMLLLSICVTLQVTREDGIGITY